MVTSSELLWRQLYSPQQLGYMCGCVWPHGLLMNVERGAGSQRSHTEGSRTLLVFWDKPHIMLPFCVHGDRDNSRLKTSLTALKETTRQRFQNYHQVLVGWTFAFCWEKLSNTSCSNTSRQKGEEDKRLKTLSLAEPQGTHMRSALTRRIPHFFC